MVAFDAAWLHAAERSLLDTGELTASWVNGFNTFASSIADAPANDQIDRSAFAGLHFASLYLPMRLDLHPSPTPSAARTLTEVHSRAEEVLWRRLLSVSMAPADGSETELVELVFGEARPKSPEAVDLTWAASVAGAARSLTREWQGRSTQPLWPAMAAHFASFFLDFFSRGIVDGSEPVPPWVDNLLADSTQPLARSHRVLKAWFTNYKHPLDGSGLPRPKRSQRYQVSKPVVPRTALELLLLS